MRITEIPVSKQSENYKGRWDEKTEDMKLGTRASLFLITRDGDVLQYWKKNTFLSNSSEISLNFEYSPTITPGLGGKQRKKKNNKNILD